MKKKIHHQNSVWVRSECEEPSSAMDDFGKGLMHGYRLSDFYSVLILIIFQLILFL